MKQIISSLLVGYTFTNGQAPPIVELPPQAPIVTPPGAVVEPPPIVEPPVVVEPPPVVEPPVVVEPPPPVVNPPVDPAPPVTPPQPQPEPAVPSYYRNPYCPPGRALEVLGQPSQNAPGLFGFPTTQNAECRSNVPGNPMSIARDFQGRLNCNNFACCLCQEITCGQPNGMPCEQIKIGDSGAVGVQNINVFGPPSNLGGSWSPWGSQGNGAIIDCAGLESCKRAKIMGTGVEKVQISGDYGCESCEIKVEAYDQMGVQCNGMLTCANAKIEVVVGPTSGITELGSFEFNGAQSAQGAELKIRNLGAQQVLIRNLECMNPTACPNLKIILEGNLMIENCDLMGFQNVNGLDAYTRSIIESCLMGQQGNFNAMPAYYPPVQQPPAYYPPVAPVQQPLPTTPLVPAQPVAPAQPATPVTPVTPALPAQQQMMMPFNPQSLKCMMNQCSNKHVKVTPANNFVMECLSACSNTKVELNIGLDPFNQGQFTERLDAFKFIGPNSGLNAVIELKTGAQGAWALIEVNDIRCEGFNACNGLKIIADAGVDIWNTNIDCSGDMSCRNCKVIQGTTSYDCLALHHAGGAFTNAYPYPMYGQPGLPGQVPPPQQYPPYPYI